MVNKYPDNIIVHSYSQNASFTYQYMYKQASRLAAGFK
jgi:hypothetical protein